MSNLLIRADASPHIGTGHIMRCLALAQAWQSTSQGTIVFVTAENLEGLEARLNEEGMQIERLTSVSGSLLDALATARLARDYGVEWTVADSYTFGAEYQRCLKREGLRLLLVDDYRHAEHYYCDLLLNQNVGAREGWYASREAYTQLLLGADYALLRREFWTWSSWQRESSSLGTLQILVTMGGADSADVTGTVLEALELLNDIDIEVELVVGVANCHRDTLARQARESRLDVKLITPTTNMPEIMARSNIAISAAGGTLRELLFMQVPTIAISIAENQTSVAQILGEMGVTISIELKSLKAIKLAHAIQKLIRSDRTRSELASAGRKVVDGQGARRVIDAMTAN